MRQQRQRGGAVVNAIAPLHQKPHLTDEEKGDPDAVAAAAAAPLDVNARPDRVAFALSSSGALVHCVRIVDATRRWKPEQDLEHPEGVTCMLRQLCVDGKDRIVTGCLDGRIRVWTRISPTPPPPPAPVDDGKRLRGGGRRRRRARGNRGNAAAASVLEATLDGHDGCAVGASRGSMTTRAPPLRPNPAPQEEKKEKRLERRRGEGWGGCAQILARLRLELVFRHGGADGRVRLWARARVPLSRRKVGRREPPAGEAAAYHWVADPVGPIISDAPTSRKAATRGAASAASSSTTVMMEGRKRKRKRKRKRRRGPVTWR